MTSSTTKFLACGTISALLALTACGSSEGPYEQSGRQADKVGGTAVSGNQGPGARAGAAIDNAIAAEREDFNNALDVAEERADIVADNADKIADRMEKRADAIRDAGKAEAEAVKKRVETLRP